MSTPPAYKCLGLRKAETSNNLLQRGRTIQQWLTSTEAPKKDDQLARAFLKGNTKATLRPISKEGRGGLLHLNDTIPSTNTKSLDILKSKQPPGQPMDPTTLVSEANDPPPIHPVIFDSIDAKSIRLAALCTEGATSPSGIDAKGWKRICTSFKSASDDICHSLALMATRICTTFVDPRGLGPFIACCLIALDKNCPIEICETVQRIIAYSQSFVLTSKMLLYLFNSAQVKWQAEVAVHAMNIAFNSEEAKSCIFGRC